MRKIIENKRKQLNNMPLDRFQNINSKFNIASKVIQTTKDTSTNDYTFIDHMYVYLENNIDVSELQINTLHAFLDDNNYDSDSLRSDLDIGVHALISQHIADIDTSTIMKFRKEYDVSNKSFDTGFKFYYWPFYKNIA
eukprot:268545_1